SSFSPLETTSFFIIDAPIGLQPGDLMWLDLYTDHAPSTVMSAPPGWTLYKDFPSSSANFHAWYYYAVAGSAEPASYSFDLDPATLSMGGIVAYGGVKTAPLADTDIAGVITGSPFVAPPLTTTQPNVMLLALF